MTANQAARHQLRLTEDRIKPDAGYARPLPALNRILYVLKGHLTVKIGDKDLRTSENHARFSSGEVEAAAGPSGATVLRYELVTTAAPAANGGPEVASTMLLETAITLERSEPYLMRCDRVDFAPRGIAPLHRHKGGGIRCLIAGGLEVRVGDHAETYKPGQAWFESGREQVYAMASPDGPTAFIRVSVFPRAILGQPSLIFADPADMGRSKGNYALSFFVDEPIEVPW
jgi:quercetin dioxygenase-like cupin family protein